MVRVSIPQTVVRGCPSECLCNWTLGSRMTQIGEATCDGNGKQTYESEKI